MTLDQLIADIADALVAVDASGDRFKELQPGVGPYGLPQLLRLVANYLNVRDPYRGLVATKRTPDLLVTWILGAGVQNNAPLR